ncbi:MAG: hypothetical protein LUI12_01370 [Clostridiales bacterium]|nr:hypothetical protein [Clostridiales bacterium]
MACKEWKEKVCKAVEGEMTLSKLDFWLLGAVLLLAGICLGLLTAPLTHGVSIGIGSNNGNYSGNTKGHAPGRPDKEACGAAEAAMEEHREKKSGKRK